MEKTLIRLFDFQKFAGNNRLTKMISDTENRYRYGKFLSGDDLEAVSAAGEFIQPQVCKDHSDDLG